MQNILVPIGISNNAKSNLKFAIKLANLFGSRIYAIDAYPSASSLTSISNVSLRLSKEKTERIRTLINQLKPAKFNFIGKSDKTRQGFLAHEVIKLMSIRKYIFDLKIFNIIFKIV